MKRKIRGSWFMLRGSWLVACGSWIVACLAALPLLGAPMVSDVTLSSAINPLSTKVSYTLTGEPAIITFEVRTNGVPVDISYAHAAGDVNHLVQPSADARSFTWAADLDWPGQTITAPTVEVVVKAWATNDPPDYAFFDLASRGYAPMYYERAADVPGGITNDIYKMEWLALRRIHAAGKVFPIGAIPCEKGYEANVKARFVTFTNDFYIGVYPITRKQYGYANPANSIETAFKNRSQSDSPYLTETDAYAWTRPAVMAQPKYYVVGSDHEWPATRGTVKSDSLLGKLRSRTGLSTIYLPTRAQWEVACRAGATSLFSNGSNTNLTEIGWYADNNTDDPRWTEGIPHAVGLKKPNAWGLYDMHGNVSEYCVDRAGEPTIAADGSPEIDPPGPTSGSHLFIGGSFSSAYTDCFAFSYFTADWGAGEVYTGYRVICNVEVH